MAYSVQQAFPQLNEGYNPSQQNMATSTPLTATPKPGGGGDYFNAALAQQLMSNAGYQTPFGGQTWDYSQTYTLPNGQKIPLPSSTVSLSPQQQQLLNTQTGLQQGIGNLAGSMFGSMGNPMQGISNLPNVNQQYQALGQMPQFNNDYVTQQQQAIMGRLQPGLDQQREQLTSQLMNQGITATSNPQAYDAAMRELNQSQNDQTMNAQIQAANQGSQMFQNQLAGYQSGVGNIGTMYNLGTQQALQPLSTFQSLYGGFQGPTIPQQQQGAPSNYLNAAQLQQQQNIANQNLQTAQQNQLLGGLFGLGSAGIIAHFLPAAL